MPKWLTSTDCLLFNVENGVARITLNRPEKRNALNTQTLRELRAALLEADDLRAAHCVVLEGAGKDFCAGYDIGGGSDYERVVKDEQGASGGPAVDSRYRSEGGLASFDDDAWQLERWHELKITIFDLHKPVIARVQGNCLAGGTDIALLCDMIIAADDARFGFPTRAHGSSVNNMWLYHLGPQWAKRLILTGDVLLGRDAATLGLVMLAVPAARLDAEVNELARRLAAIDTDLLSANKRIINQGLELMGARTLQRMSHETDTRAHQAKARAAFRTDVATRGLKEALKRRDAPFGDGVVRLDR